jgi:hypothetical protein
LQKRLTGFSENQSLFSLLLISQISSKNKL